MSEIRLHKSLRHPNIVKFEHVFEDQENVYILLELCDSQVTTLYSYKLNKLEYE